MSSVVLVDGQSALYNPGALGVYHLDRYLSVSAPSNTRWLPALADDLRMKTSSFSGGISTRSLNRSGSKINLGLSFAYSRQRLDLGEQLGIGESPADTTGLFGSHETANYYTGSLGLDYHGIRLGVGVTRKEIFSQLATTGPSSEIGQTTAEASATDWGMLLELPIIDMINGFDNDNTNRAEWTNTYTLSIAYLNANSASEKLTYIDASQADPLPHLSRLGLSLYAAHRYNGAVAFSGRLVAHQERSLIGGSNNSYPHGFGLEIGIYDVMYTRLGRYIDSEGDIHLTSWGIGFSTAGIGAWLIATNESGLSPMLRFLAKHVELSIDFAMYNPDGDAPHPLDGSKFLKAGFTIR